MADEIVLTCTEVVKDRGSDPDNNSAPVYRATLATFLDHGSPDGIYPQVRVQVETGEQGRFRAGRQYALRLEERRS